MGNSTALCDKSSLTPGCDVNLISKGSMDPADSHDIIFIQWSNILSIHPLTKAPYTKHMSQIIATFESWLRDGVSMLDPPSLGVLEVATIAASFASAVSTRVNRLCQEHPQVRFGVLKNIWDQYPSLRECEEESNELLLATLRYITLIAVVKAAFRTCDREITEDEINDCTSKFIAIESSNLCSSVKEWIETRLPGTSACFYGFKDDTTIVDLSVLEKTETELKRIDVPACNRPYDTICAHLDGGHILTIPFSGKEADDIIGVCELKKTEKITEIDHWMADAFLREFSFVLEKARINTIIMQFDPACLVDEKQNPAVAVST